MSWEAWGTPPDTEPELCPICDNTQHTPDKCEVAAAEDHARKHYEGAIALLLQDRERRLTEAYAEGRRDEAEEHALRPIEPATESLAAHELMPVERIAMLWNSLPLETDAESVVAFVRAVERFHGITRGLTPNT